jgi:hypothetical protein
MRDPAEYGASISSLQWTWVEPDASVKSIARQDSSGNRAFDDAAMSSALNSTYDPATANCKPVEGTYLYLEMFDPF